MLTALIRRPSRLVHHSGEGSLADLDWKKRTWDPAKAYAESKLHAPALALAQAECPEQRLRSRLGAYEDGRARRTGRHRDQPANPGLARRKSDDPAAMVSGRYWHHLRQEQPAGEAMDREFQDELVARLGELTGVALPPK
ncbi:hypothetical protein ACVINU_005766 [Bradyrhizobium diazoefficiens]